MANPPKKKVKVNKGKRGYDGGRGASGTTTVSNANGQGSKEVVQDLQEDTILTNSSGRRYRIIVSGKGSNKRSQIQYLD